MVQTGTACETLFNWRTSPRGYARDEQANFVNSNKPRGSPTQRRRLEQTWKEHEDPG